jgi:hypothetical protein
VARDGVGALQIEFEDDDPAQDRAQGPASIARSRDLRPFTMLGLGAAVMATAMWAAASAQSHAGSAATVPPVSAHDYAAYVVTVSYRGARLLSEAQRRIEVDIHVTPVKGASVSVIKYSVGENGVLARADPPPSSVSLPASGTDVRLNLTVTDCAVVPIGESMSYVDVVTDGPSGTMDRFTILGERYSADLAHLLEIVCPGRRAPG